MTNLQIAGRQEFMGKEMPIILNGFSKGKKVITDKTVAEIHDMRESDIRRRVADNIKRFTNNVDFIDLKSYASDAQQLLIELDYSQMQISKAEHIYAFSERGYAKLIKIMNTDLAWEIHDKLVDEYFKLKEVADPYAHLSPQVQVLIEMDLRIQETENRIDTLEGTMTIDHEQSKQLKDLATKTILKILGGSKFPAYKKIGKKVFAQLWKDYKNHFNVSSYMNTAVVDYAEAKYFITNWKPNEVINLLIAYTNNSSLIN